MPNGKIQSFTDLNAWKESHKLVLLVYKYTTYFPKEEIFGLTNQIRRAVVSIVSNIAEGFGRQSYKEKTQFYSVAQGSNLELQSQMLVARDIKYLKEKDFKEIADQSIIVGKLLSGLIKTTKEYSSKS
jgi:four helix bundle protein